MKNTRGNIPVANRTPVSRKSKGIFQSGWLKLILRVVKLFFIVFILGSIFFVLLYKFVSPPVTFLMIERGFEQKAAGKPWKIEKQWIGFDNIADPMKRAAVAAEDQTFLENHGFDFKAIEKAIDKNARSHKLQGGSTISQQTAKNVFLWPGRSYIRKGIEAWFTLLIEIFWSKKRIMEVYLNEIEMGDGIYGVEAASHTYFHKPASELTNYQAAAIASIWPSPLKWSPTNSSDYVRHRQYLIRKNMKRLGPLDF